MGPFYRVSPSHKARIILNSVSFLIYDSEFTGLKRHPQSPDLSKPAATVDENLHLSPQKLFHL